MPARKQRQAPNWLRQRAIGSKDHHRESQRVSTDSMRRLKLESTLEGHSACVNCLDWNWSGNLLASGSDDQNIIIWDPFKATKRNLIRTGHEGTIFSVKFIPDFCDNLLASCAGDGSVKVINVLANETVLNCQDCHIDRVKRLTVHPNEPHLVWSAGEDSFIMQYDIREPHTCSENGDKNLLLDLRRGGADVAAKCLAINPMRDEMLAVGSTDVHVRLFDRRMMRQKGWNSCMAYFTPGHLVDRHDYKTARKSFDTTYLAFSPDGSELLVNKHAEQIYLFKTYEPWECYKSFEATVKPLILDHPSSTTLQGCRGGGDHHHQHIRSSSPLSLSSQRTLYAPWKELRKLSGCVELPQEHRKFFQDLDEKLRSQSKIINRKEMDKINELLLEYKNCPELYRLRASALIQRSWRGDPYQAIRDSCCALALKPLDYQSLENLALATCNLGDKESASGLLEIIRIIQLDFAGLQEASRALSDCLRGSPHDYRYSSWFHELQPAADDNDEVAYRPFREANISPINLTDFYGNNNNNNNSSHRLLSNAKTSPNEAIPGGNGGLNDDSTMIVKNRTEYDLKNMGAFDYAKRYCGHCNMNTDIKEANFFGYHGEFIVGGSDDGAFYIWDKETTNIVKAVYGDLNLNCLQPHPSICMLATSGIESSVKLWSPSGKVNHDVGSLEVRCNQNQEFIISDPLEAMMMLIYQPNQRDTLE